MVQEILKIFMEQGFLLDKEMLGFFNQLQDENLAKEILDKISLISKERVVTKTLINNSIDKFQTIFHTLEKDKKEIINNFFIKELNPLKPKSEQKIEINDFIKTSPSVKILSSPVLASQKIEARDFVKHFRNRYLFLKEILQTNSELKNLTSIDKIGGSTRDFSIIGIVNDKKITKNHNIILEVEDLTGRINVLINQNKEDIFQKAGEIVLDDVVAFKCNGTREFVFVNDLFYPDSYLDRKKRSKEEAYALFISDIHLGSGNFLKEIFQRFINWLRGEGSNEKQKEILKKIKYLFIVGDSIDGVGIYPGQEKDLIIKDIQEQYVELAKYLEQIPKHIQIIQCAGQHDAVRVAEPQPPIGEDFAEPLHKIKNLTLVSNPSLVEIDGNGEESGFKVLMYHGASMHGLINEVEELRASNAHSTPAKVVTHLLKRRHLAPTHGAGTIYIPNKDEDSMLIREIPDIITTGDLHRCDIEIYNNILIISCGCWQSMTAFEEKVGNNPDPGKVPILNLKTREIRVLDFT